MKSVSSAPICNPAPNDPVPIADGADQALIFFFFFEKIIINFQFHLEFEKIVHPFDSLATTKPKPTLPLKRKPAFTTVNTTSPYFVLLKNLKFSEKKEKN